MTIKKRWLLTGFKRETRETAIVTKSIFSFISQIIFQLRNQNFFFRKKLLTIQAFIIQSFLMLRNSLLALRWVAVWLLSTGGVGAEQQILIDCMLTVLWLLSYGKSPFLQWRGDCGFLVCLLFYFSKQGI